MGAAGVLKTVRFDRSIAEKNAFQEGANRRKLLHRQCLDIKEFDVIPCDGYTDSRIERYLCLENT